jgi:formylmethanofuran dehydrogenase subunit D
MNNTLMAKRGDVVLVTTDYGETEATGIVAGARVACRSQSGLLMMPARCIVAAWGV